MALTAALVSTGYDSASPTTSAATSSPSATITPPSSTVTTTPSTGPRRRLPRRRPRHRKHPARRLGVSSVLSKGTTCPPEVLGPAPSVVDAGDRSRRDEPVELNSDISEPGREGREIGPGAVEDADRLARKTPRDQIWPRPALGIWKHLAKSFGDTTLACRSSAAPRPRPWSAGARR
jgi:hypothetical protein